MAKRDKEYDYDFMPTSAYDKQYNDLIREEQKNIDEENEKIRSAKIKSKGEYDVPDEFDYGIYSDYIKLVGRDKIKKINDDYDAEYLRDYMWTLRNYYADSMYFFHKKYDPQGIQTFSPFLLGNISGNKLEFDDIKQNKVLAKENKDKFLENEAKLIMQRLKYGTYDRTIQALFNRKNTFLVLQHRGLEAKLMNHMYNEGFYIDLGIKSTKELKKMHKEKDSALLEDFYNFPIMKEIMNEKSKERTTLDQKCSMLEKCIDTKEALEKLQPLFMYGKGSLDNFDLYADCQYVSVMRNVTKKSIQKLDKLIAEIKLQGIDRLF